jgi:hypothetical protein
MRSLAILTIAVALGVVPAALAAPASSGVRGRVLAGPTCPVERPGDPACAPRAVVAIVTVSTPRHRVIRSVRSGSDGRFALTLAPGTYVLEPRAPAGPLPSGRPVLIHVRTGKLTRVVLSMDTGIR